MNINAVLICIAIVAWGLAVGFYLKTEREERR